MATDWISNSNMTAEQPMIMKAKLAETDSGISTSNSHFARLELTDEEAEDSRKGHPNSANGLEMQIDIQASVKKPSADSASDRSVEEQVRMSNAAYDRFVEEQVRMSLEQSLEGESVPPWEKRRRQFFFHVQEKTRNGLALLMEEMRANNQFLGEGDTKAGPEIDESDTKTASESDTETTSESDTETASESGSDSASESDYVSDTEALLA